MGFALFLQDYIINSEELTLSQLVEKYQESFPLFVRVCKGFYGSSDRTSVSEGDSFNIHFVKKSKVLYESESDNHAYSLARVPPLGVHIACG